MLGGCFLGLGGGVGGGVCAGLMFKSIIASVKITYIYKYFSHDCLESKD